MSGWLVNYDTSRKEEGTKSAGTCRRLHITIISLMITVAASQVMPSLAQGAASLSAPLVY